MKDKKKHHHKEINPRGYKIVDQALSLKFNFKDSKIEGSTSIRMKLPKESLIQNILQTRLCAKQMKIQKIEVENLQMYDETTKNLQNFNKKTSYFVHTVYPNPMKQLRILKKNFEKIPRSCHSIRQISRNIYNEESAGFIRVSLELNKAKTLEKIIQLFDQGYKAYFTLKINFSIDDPVIGGFFLKTSEGKNFFLKDNKISYARNIFPCLDCINDYYYFSKIRIALDEKMEIFCLGEKKNLGEIQPGVFVTEFEVNKILNPNFLPLIIGKFYKVKIPINPEKNFKGKEQKKNENSQSKNFIEYNCQNKETAYHIERKVEDQSEFLKKLRDFETEKLKLASSFSEKCQWIILDNFFLYDLDEIAELEYTFKNSSFFFYSTMILDSALIPDSNSLDTNLFIQSEIIRKFALTIHTEKLALESINDFWYISGASSFIADIFIMLNSNDNFNLAIMDKKRKKYYSYVEKGRDLNPLMNTNFMHPAEAFSDHCYNVKANLIFTLVFSMLKLTKNTAAGFASLMLNEDYVRLDKNGKNVVRFTGSDRVFKKIKVAFGVKNLKSDLFQYLFKTGTCELDCAYIYNRKENKMKLSIRQTPLSMGYYKKRMQERFGLEKFFNLISPIKKILENFETALVDLASNSEEFINHDNIKQFLEDDGRILVNREYNCLKYIGGTFNVIVTETNDIEYREDIYDVSVRDLQEQEVTFYMRAKFRRVVQKKGYDQYNIGFNEDEKDPGLIGGAPYLWLKLDPYNEYLRKIVIRDGENILLAQLEKDVKDQIDLSNIYRILESLEGNSTHAAFKKIAALLKTKKLAINEMIKIKMVEALTRIELKNLEPQIAQILISLVKKFKFESDHSLKPNDFEDEDQPYYLINYLIRTISSYERKCKKSKLEAKHMKHGVSRQLYHKVNPQTDEGIVSTLLHLLQKNDNSLNSFNDVYYQSNILKSLLNCLNIANVNQILNEVNRFLKIEFYTKYEYKFLLKTIFEHFPQYITNHYEHLGISLASSEIEIWDHPALNKFPKLVEALGFLKKLAQRHECDIVLANSVFKLNLHLNKKIKMLKPWEILIWALKYIESVRMKANIYVVHNLCEEFCRYVEKNSQDFRNIEKPLSLQNQKLLNSILFDSITAPHCFLDAQMKFLMMRLYRQIYSDFLPICFLNEFENHTFPFDNNWLSFRYKLNFEKSVSNEAKMITLKYLSLQKRKKAISGPMGPVQGSSKYNTRDLILQNFKFNKEPVNWKNLCKQIVNVLMSERWTMDIEADLEEEENNLGKFKQVGQSNEEVKIISFFIFFSLF